MAVQKVRTTHHIMSDNKQPSTKKHGDLEKYLGSKYAKELNNLGDLNPIYEESRNILNQDLNGMGLFNQAMLAVNMLKGSKNRVQRQHGAA